MGEVLKKVSLATFHLMDNNMNEFVIKQLTVSEVQILRQVSIDTFIDTYSKFNTAENMQMYVQQHFNEEQLISELESDSNFFFGIFDGDALAGYTKLRTTEHPEELKWKKHIELERIYAAKKYHGKGLGYRMMHYCLQFASENNYDVLWLGVWEKNERAIHFYKKSGFEIFSRHVFMLGTDEQTDWLMKKELNHAK